MRRVENERRNEGKREERKKERKKEGKKGESGKRRENINVCLIIDVSVN